MAHNRVNIKAALKALLLDATDAEDRVFVNREQKVSQSELPCIIIYTPQEESTPSAFPLSRYIRTLQLLIEVRVEASGQVDDDVDNLLAEIEAILLANQSISGTATQGASLASSEVRVNSDGEKDIGVGVLTYQCKYIS